MGPKPKPPPLALEQVTLVQALIGPHHFSAGMTVSAKRDDRGQVSATLQAAGQIQQLSLPGRADFYALSNRPDLIIVHDRYSTWEDTLRVYNFSPAGVRVRTFGHGTRGQGHNCRLYHDLRLVGRGVQVREEFSVSGRLDRPPVNRRFYIPFD